MTGTSSETIDRGAADTARQAAVAAAFAAVLATNTLANVLPLNGRTTGEVSNQYPIQITPPGYVFSIWSLIYLGMTGYATYQALPAQRANARLRKVAWPFVLSCAANIAWIFLWHYGFTKLTLAAMLGLLIALIVVYAGLDRGAPAPFPEWLLVRLPFSIYLGWIAVATIVNTTVVLYDTGWDGLGIDPQIWTSGLLATGAGLSMAVAPTQRDAAFALVSAWAFSGVAIKQKELNIVAPAAWTAAATALAAAGLATWLQPRPHPGD